MDERPCSPLLSDEENDDFELSEIPIARPVTARKEVKTPINKSNARRSCGVLNEKMISPNVSLKDLWDHYNIGIERGLKVDASSCDLLTTPSLR